METRLHEVRFCFSGPGFTGDGTIDVKADEKIGILAKVTRAGRGWLLPGVLFTVAVAVWLRDPSGPLGSGGEILPVIPWRSEPYQFSQPPMAEAVSGTSPLSSTPVAPVVNEARWETEEWAAQSDTQLRRLAEWLPAGGEKESFPDIAAASFSAPPLRPERLTPLYTRNGLIVSRGETKAEAPLLDDLQEALEPLVRSLPDRKVSRFSFKTVRVRRFEEREKKFHTEVLVEVSCAGDRRAIQANGRWRCVWHPQENGEPRLASIRLDSYEEIIVRAEATAAVGFVDSTRAVLGEHAGLAQHAMGIDEWSQRLTRIDEMTLHGHHGLSVGDIDGDGLDDLYLCDGGGLPNRLYLQNPDGTLRDFSRASQTDWLESSSASLLIDLDNDGDQDLVVATIPLILFSENDGQGRFAFRGGHPAVGSAYTMAAADFDNDGDVDIYITSYSGRGAEGFGLRGFEAQAPVPFHDANNGGRNVMLENQGGFDFVDVTERVGLDENNRRFSFSASWEDFDNDGDLDLYVANDFGRNNLYQNDNGNFVDVAQARGVEDIGAGMSVDWADCNHDGLMDVYVGNMFSAAGNRVVFQGRFTAGRDADSAGAVQRMARGNALFLGQAGQPYKDVSAVSGASMGKWAWSSKFIDVNNDGWEDILVANGYLSNRRPDDL